MNASVTDNHFEPLPLKRKTLASVDANQYCVQAASGEAREIKADTAYEAFLKSGIKDAIKIERMSNLGQAVIEKSKFMEESAAGDAPMTLHDRMHTSRNPVISADDLDELMRALEKESDQVIVSSAAGSAAAAPLSSSSGAGAPAAANSAVGVDVHGDGFDEIIPAAPAAKAAAAKPAETGDGQKAMNMAGASSQSGSELPPERELSPEEVEKLLQNK